MHFKTKDIVSVGVMTAVICVLSPFSLPIGPVPISLGNFAIFLTLYILGWKRGALATLLFLLIGLAGVPVFSSFSAGPAKLLGPTGGYLIGYLPMALIAGVVIERTGRKRIPSVIGMVCATVILYALGTAWLAYGTGMTFSAALKAGVIPFALLDFMKMLACALIGPVLYNTLKSAHVI